MFPTQVKVKPAKAKAIGYAGFIVGCIVPGFVGTIVPTSFVYWLYPWGVDRL
jgi:hypothetical protein